MFLEVEAENMVYSSHDPYEREDWQRVSWGAKLEGPKVAET